MIIAIQEKEVVCSNCQHFVQHYVCFGGFTACNAGHCTYPRIKDRKPGQVGCDYFKEKEAKPNASNL